MKFPNFKDLSNCCSDLQDKKVIKWMIGTNIDTGSFVYMLVDLLDTAGIVRLFVTEVVRAELVENKIENRY